jgi:hypothetical protein
MRLGGKFAMRQAISDLDSGAVSMSSTKLISNSRNHIIVSFQHLLQSPFFHLAKTTSPRSRTCFTVSVSALTNHTTSHYPDQLLVTPCHYVIRQQLYFRVWPGRNYDRIIGAAGSFLAASEDAEGTYGS